jgi:hypothetical protein
MVMVLDIQAILNFLPTKSYQNEKIDKFKTNTSFVNIIISGVKLTFNRNIVPFGGVRTVSMLKIKPVTLILFFETY